MRHADLLALVDSAQAGSLFPDSRDHGVDHWRGVTDQALWLAERFKWDSDHRRVAFVFGAVHDCRRLNDGFDPDHGERAADWLVSTDWLTRLGLDHLEDRLVDALIRHDQGDTCPADPLTSLGWDADRSLLARVGITPSPDFFSTVQGADFAALISRGAQVIRRPQDWTSLARRALA